MKSETDNIPAILREKYRHYGEPWGDYKLELPKDKMLYEIVTIMRANPPHLNHVIMLEELCKKAVKVNLNLGSSNKFDKKNPFKIEEREDMVRLALKDHNNYEILRLPDVGDDEEWFDNLCEINGSFSEIVSNNQYDLNIYRKHQYNQDGYKKYDIISPADIVDQREMVYVEEGVLEGGAIFKPLKKPMYVSGTFIRAAMVNDWNWEDFVDKRVAKYIKDNNLVQRIADFCPELRGISLEELDDGR